MRNYKKIRAWQRSHELVMFIYKLTRAFPRQEMFGLVVQLRRASVSVASNIVEGSNRKSKKDYIRFLYNAKASLREVEYQMFLSKELGYFTEIKFQEFSALLDKAMSSLYGLIRSVEAEATQVHQGSLVTGP